MESDFDIGLRTIVSAGERTRGIIYFLALIFAALFAVSLEYNLFDWTTARHNIISGALNCYKSARQRQDFAMSHDCLRYYWYVERNYKIPVMSEITCQMISESNSELAITERYKKLSSVYVENTSTTIPILGVKIDVNSELILINVFMIITIFFLHRSIKGETQSVTAIISYLATKSQANSVINSHIFARPRVYSLFWLGLLIPALYCTYLTYSDFKDAEIVEFLLGFGFMPGSNTVFYAMEIVTTSILWITSVICFWSAKNLDNALYTVQTTRDGLPEGFVTG